jgi:hypothetical protein
LNLRDELTAIWQVGNLASPMAYTALPVNSSGLCSRRPWRRLARGDDIAAGIRIPLMLIVAGFKLIGVY